MLIQRVGIFGGCLVMFSLLFGFVAFDTILKYVLRKQVALKEGHEVRRFYLKLPFPLGFCVYFFNVSNPMEVQTGATPILNEIGPYCYDEYVEKVNVVDSDGEDSLTYSPYVIFKFNQNKSGNLNDGDSVTILHPLVIDKYIVEQFSGLDLLLKKRVTCLSKHQAFKTDDVATSPEIVLPLTTTTEANKSDKHIVLTNTSDVLHNLCTYIGK